MDCATALVRAIVSSLLLELSNRQADTHPAEVPVWLTEGLTQQLMAAATVDLIQRGLIPPDESIVICVTGNGYKTAEVVQDRLAEPVRLSRSFREFESWWESRQALA